MIIRSLSRSRPLLQSRVSALAKCVSAPPQRHRYHKVPELNVFEKKGVPGLLTPKAFNIAYTDYQGYIVDQLKQDLAGTQYEDHEIRDLVIDLARDPQHAHRFNLASMAFNNNFFFSGLSAEPTPETPNPELQYHLETSFSSLDTLRETFLTTAEAMFGPGFVWLVQNAHPTSVENSFRILPTYLAGSPLSGAHYRKQTTDMNTQNIDSYQEEQRRRGGGAKNTAGSFGATSASQQGKGVKKAKGKGPLGGVDVTPLLCVNTWEHVWLTDYGVRRKREYLEAWWKKINWRAVGEKAITPKVKDKSFSYGM